MTSLCGCQINSLSNGRNHLNELDATSAWIYDQVLYISSDFCQERPQNGKLTNMNCRGYENGWRNSPLNATNLGFNELIRVEPFGKIILAAGNRNCHFNIESFQWWKISSAWRHFCFVGRLKIATVLNLWKLEQIYSHVDMALLHFLGCSETCL